MRKVGNILVGVHHVLPCRAEPLVTIFFAHLVLLKSVTSSHSFQTSHIVQAPHNRLWSCWQLSCQSCQPTFDRVQTTDPNYHRTLPGFADRVGHAASGYNLLSFP